MVTQLKKKVKAQILHEHLMKFMADNRQSGFELEGVIFSDIPRVEHVRIKALDLNILCEVMMILEQYDEVPQSIIKNYARRLQESSNKVLKYDQVLDILSRMFGYRNHNGLDHSLYPGMNKEERHLAKKSAKEMFVVNRRDKKSIDLPLFTLNDLRPTHLWSKTKSDIDYLINNRQ